MYVPLDRERGERGLQRDRTLRLRDMPALVMTQRAMPNLPWIISRIDTLPASFLVLLFGIGAAVLIFWRLGQGNLEPSDEAIYARIAREMVWSGDWVTPRWNYETWFEKPPLMMWITAAFFQLFGVSELWIRAASASCGVATIIITYLLASNLYGRAVGAISVAVLATCEHFIWSARVGMSIPLLRCSPCSPCTATRVLNLRTTVGGMSSG